MPSKRPRDDTQPAPCIAPCRRARVRDGAATDVEAEEHAREHHPQPCPHRTDEEVRSQQDIEMETDELPPRHGRFALRGWWNAVTFQDVAHRLVADTIAQVGQGTHNAVIAPRTILAGHPHHEVFDLFLNARTANRLRGWERSHCRSTHVRCQARMVSGLATVAISARAFLSNFWPISASSLRSLSVSCTRPVIC